MSGKIPPLNQSYRIDETLALRPEVRTLYRNYKRWAKKEVCWRSIGRPDKVHVGRVYDCALTLASLSFKGLDVAELGARASFLAPYLTRDAASVHVSDEFGRSHWELGKLPYWTRLWKRAAFHPERLTAGIVDMRATGFESESFDVVISFSAIEHIVKPEDGDTMAAREMGRICRPGGYVIISTDISDQFRKYHGYMYDEEALWERLIRPTGCEMYGEADLAWEGSDKGLHRDGGFESSACLFVLRKPE